MRKYIIYILIFVVILGGSAAGYLYLKKARATSKSGISAIPTDALLIWRVSELTNTSHRLAHNSILWEELSLIPALNETNRTIHIWDSIITSSEALAEFADTELSFFSWHSVGKQDIGWLAISELDMGTDIQTIQSIFNEIGGESQSRILEETTLYSWRLGGKQYHYTIQDNAFIISTYGSLVESSVKQSKSDSSLLNDSRFNEAYQTAGTPENGILLYNTNRIHSFLNPFAKQNINKSVSSTLLNIGGWSAMDLSLKSNAIMLSGFTEYADSSGVFLEQFEDQQPEDHDFIDYVPENTAAFIHYGFSNLNGWFSKKKEGLELNTRLFDFDKKIAEIENLYGISYEKHLLSWMEHEVAFGFLEGRSTDINEQAFVVTKAGNIQLAKKKLKEIENRTALLSSETPELIDSTIGFIGIPEVFQPLFGKPFNHLKQGYYSILGKYVFWANNPRILKEIQSASGKKETLGRSDGYEQLEEHVSEESNVYLYANIARSASYLDQFLNSSYAPNSQEDLEYLRKFQAVTYQYSFEKPGLFYTHAYFVHNPIYKEASFSLWELALDAPSSMKPVIVKNHYTGAKEVFIQDNKNNIYLISNSGKILWKRPLSEPLISEVQQIDVYGNNKLQLLFNTRSKVFLIDRNGNDVPGFSIELEEKATTGLTCLDYANNNQYRILVPAENGILYDFDNEGIKVKGWKHKAENSNFLRPIQYFSIKNKDYLVAQLEDGTVKAYDRRGRERIKAFENKITRKPGIASLKIGNTLGSTFLTTTDSSGTVSRLFLDGKLENNDFGNYSPRHLFKLVDLNQDGNQDYLFADEEKVVGYDVNGDLLLEYKVPQGDITHINTYMFKSGTSIGITTDLNEIYLIDKTEQVLPFFPMNGASAFSITDVNADGTFNLLVTDVNGLLYCYQIEQ